VTDSQGSIPVLLTKKLSFSSGDLDLRAEYEIKNDGSRPLDARFLSEWNLTLLAGDNPDRYYFVDGRRLEDARLCSQGDECGVVRAGMTDRWLGLNVVFEASPSARFLRYPVETVSQSEGGFERVYQGSPLVLTWHPRPRRPARGIPF